MKGLSIKATKSPMMFKSDEEKQNDARALAEQHGVNAEEQMETLIKDGVQRQGLHIVSELGRGASSVVYKVSGDSGDDFAMKVLDISDDTKRKQMVQEIQLMSTFDHPCLVQFLNCYTTATKAEILIEFMDLGGMDGMIAKAEDNILPDGVIASILSQVLLALQYLHEQQKVMHRDLKPANIFLNTKGDVKVGDFGVSGANSGDDGSIPNFVGTAKYMSPERLQGDACTPAGDIWAVGLIALEAANGEFPYISSGNFLDFMSQVVDEPVPLPPHHLVSAELRSFVDACMQKNPSNRPSARDLLSHPFVQLSQADGAGGMP